MPLRVLSIIIPVYNGENTLRACLDSILSRYDSRIEVMIVNDGSTDTTDLIAVEYMNLYPKNVKVISKINGGHGSGINEAVKVIEGKYFKVIDADDTVDTENLNKFIDFLAFETSDAVLTNYCVINLNNGAVKDVCAKNITYGRKYNFKSFYSSRKGIMELCTFHGVTYNTSFYLNCGIKLCEKIFYDDQQFSSQPFAWANRISVFGLVIYRYSIGNPGQSVSNENLNKHIDDLKVVLFVMLSSIGGYFENERISFMEYRCKELLLNMYVILRLRLKDKERGYFLVKELRKYLFKNYRRLWFRTSLGYLLCMQLSFLGVSSETIFKFSNNPFYRFIKKLAH